MILSQETKIILNNFSKINPSMYFMEGNVLRTMSLTQTVVGRAVVPNIFPREFGIYDLSRFLNALSLFKEPDIDFKDDHLVISEGSTKIKYVYAGKNMVYSPFEHDIVFPSDKEIVHFNLTMDQINSVNKALNVLGLTDMIFETKDKNIIIRGENIENIKSLNSDNYTINVGQSDVDFTVTLKKELFSYLLISDYEVRIAKGKKAYISWFKNEKVEYFLICSSL